MVPPYDAEIVADEGVVVVDVLTVKFALIDPAGIVSDAGTCTTPVLLLVSITTAPPPGAEAVSETVPVGCPWLFTDDWLSDTADSDAPDPGVEVGTEGVDDVAGAGVGEGEEGVPLPQPVSGITRLAANRHDKGLSSEVHGIWPAVGATRSPAAYRQHETTHSERILHTATRGLLIYGWSPRSTAKTQTGIGVRA